MSEKESKSGQPKSQPSDSPFLFAELGADEEAAKRAKAAAKAKPVRRAGSTDSRRSNSANRPRTGKGPRPTLFVDVALNRPVRGAFTYGVPDDCKDAVQAGVRVAVPFGQKREVGVVVRVSKETKVNINRVRNLARVLEREPVVDEGLLELTRWMADEYACSWGQALAAVLPAPLKRESEARRVRMLCAVPGIDPERIEDLAKKHPKQHRLLRTLIELGGPVEMRDILRKTNLSDAPATSLVRKGLVELERALAQPEDLLSSEASGRTRPEQLTTSQEWALRSVAGPLEEGKHATFLLRGVTGSGKTEVYLRVIERALELGRGAIVLVPEIALTPQTVSWFRSRFDEIAVLHSRMTDSQRLRMWSRLRSGDARVVVGARSAVFAPIANLGVIVVDEEHEPSFKQGSTPRYHARDVARRRAEVTGAVCVLGSATPALETWQAARSGGMRLLNLPERIGGSQLPPVEIVDMRIQPVTGQGEGGEIFSRPLRLALEEVLGKQEQAILFLNRRGYTPVLWCQGCGETVRCGQCDASLSYHRRIKRLVCHLCCDERELSKNCPTCTRPGLRMLGAGSERVEGVLQKLFPNVRVRRMDSDTMLRREDYETSLEAFRKREVDVLVGTQMIAKGLDFPGVTLVGIISADTSLHLPDFRADERTYQLIEQVSGRAGRGDRAGRVLVQTQCPERFSIRLAGDHDFEGFAKHELENRMELGYPPFGRLIRGLFEDAEEERILDACRALVECLSADPPIEGMALLGPVPAPFAYLRGRHRRHILVKCTDSSTLALARERMIDFAEKSTRPRLAVDVDPVSLL